MQFLTCFSTPQHFPKGIAMFSYLLYIQFIKRIFTFKGYFEIFNRLSNNYSIQLLHFEGWDYTFWQMLGRALLTAPLCCFLWQFDGPLTESCTPCPDLWAWEMLKPRPSSVATASLNECLERVRFLSGNLFLEDPQALAELRTATARSFRNETPFRSHFGTALQQVLSFKQRKWIFYYLCWTPPIKTTD